MDADITDAVVTDVKNNLYILKTADGTIYKIPTGPESMELHEGLLLGLGDNKFLRVNLPSNENTSSISEKKNADWSNAATKALISQYAILKPLVESRQIKTMKKMWEQLTNELDQFGYKYTTTQVETKWKSLERAFKTTIDNAKKTGRGKRSCPFERELGEILLKRNSVVPPCVLDEISIQRRDEVLETSGLEVHKTENEENNTSRTSTPVSERETVRKGRNQELKLLVEAIQRRTEEKRAIEDRKYEQKERFIEAIKERNKLLEKLTNNANP